MKVEVEAHELTALHNEIEKLKVTNRQLEARISELSEYKLIERALRLSNHVVDRSFRKIFSELGFDQSDDYITVQFPDSRIDGVNWWESENVEISLSATVKEKFSIAFIKSGVIPPAKRKEVFKQLSLDDFTNDHRTDV